MRSLAVLLGVLPAVFLAGAPPMLVIMLLALAICAGFAMSRPGPALVLLLSFLIAQGVVREVLANRVACEERVIATAKVVSVPVRTDGGWMFDAVVSHPRQAGRPDLRARIEFPHAGAHRPRAGETWQLLLNYAEPAGPVAEGVRDSRWILLRDRIEVRARAIPSQLNRLRVPAGTSWLTLREKVADRIIQRAVDPSAGALLAALAVGVTGEVSDRQWRVFNATGITHLIAISGMHVTFFALISMWLARRLWSQLSALQRSVRRECFAAVVGVLLAAGYALLSGFSVPAQRTLLMLAAFLALRECSRESTPFASVGVATVAILVWDPLAVLGAGFWLSFAAVGAIVLMPGQRVRTAGTLAAAVDVQRCVSIALLPLTLLIFGMFSCVGLIVNAFAIPVFTLALVPCVLLATLGYLMPAAPLHWVADQLIDLAAWLAGPVWTVLGQAADLPGAVWHATPDAPGFLLAVGAAVCALLPFAPMVRGAALGVLALGFVEPVAAPPPGSAWIEVLDVGAETAVLVRTTGHSLLAGTAETFGSRGRRFESRVLPLLRTRVEPPLDLAIVGVLNRDRLGAVGVAQALLPARQWAGRVRSGELPPEFAACGPRAWRWDAVGFQLAPPAVGEGCMLKVTSGAQSAWLPLEFNADAFRTLDLLPSPGPAMLLLPRRPLVPGPAGEHREGRLLAVASISAREQRSDAWRRYLQNLRQQGLSIVSTAQGHVVVELGPERTYLRRTKGIIAWRDLFAFPADLQCRIG